MTEHSRPYDPDLMINLAQHMVDQGSRVVSPPHEPGTIPVAPEIDPHPGRIEESVTALRGLFRVFTVAGRADRTEEKLERLHQRDETVAFMADRMSNPRTKTSPVDPTEKLGWVGTHKRELGSTWREEDSVNQGYQLFRKGPLFSEPSTPNLNRPVTMSEHATSRRLEAKSVKRAKLLNDSRWLRGSYGDALDRESPHRLSRSERWAISKRGAQVNRLEKKAAKVTEKFDEIAGGEDTRGAINKLRINNAELRKAGLEYKLQRKEERRLKREESKRQRQLERERRRTGS